jgi:hypothetical protein
MSRLCLWNPQTVPDLPPAPHAIVSAGAQPVARANISTREVDLEVAAAKGRVADGIDVEVFSASARLTADQLTVQLCARVSLLFFTLGACVENPF